MSDEPTGDGAQTPEVTTPVAETVNKSFSQDEVDRIIKERLAREKEKYAGFEDYKNAAAKLKEIEDSQKSEAEKLAARLADAEARAKAGEESARAAKRGQMLLQAAFDANAHNPSDANFEQAVAGIDPTSETAESEIKQKVEALKAEKPYLFKKQGIVYEKGNPAEGGVKVETTEQRRSRLSGGGGNLFDPTNAAAMGGGVVISKGTDLT